jgi:hypothetical protein
MVLTAPTFRRKKGEFDYLSYLEAVSPLAGGLNVKPIEGATHSFAEGPSKEMVRMYIEQWLHDHFGMTSKAATGIGQGFDGCGLVAHAYE